MSAGHPYTSQRLSYRFLFAAGVVLLLGISAGTLGAIQFGWGGEGFLGDVLPFYKLRPLHVTFVIAWLFVASMGGLFYALPEVSRRELYSVRLGKWQFWIMTWTGLGILATYGAGIFSGREYFNFWPPFALAILVAWALFCINVFKTIKGRLDRWPVYLWMWVTGLVVFVYTFLEGHLWLLPFFRDNIARDLTVQWKSYGSFIGSWNMLIYGLLFYLMQRLEGEGEGDQKLGYRRVDFFFYWLALANLMFGIGHHTYHVPQSLVIRYLGFGVSMTESIVLVKIIADWAALFRKKPWAIQGSQQIPFLFVLAATLWLVLNLILALLFSIPLINSLTHGTHVTVAHAMGSTIGINSLILWAVGFFILTENGEPLSPRIKRFIWWGFWMVNLCLLVFWIDLIALGLVRGVATIDGLSFYSIVEKTRIYMQIFAVSGIGLFLGMILLLSQWFPLILRRHREAMSAVG